MFYTSSQREHWMYESEEALINEKSDCMKNYKNDRISEISGSSDKIPEFLTDEEERLLTQYYEQRLRDFCLNFVTYNSETKLPIENVHVPFDVIYTANTYFKRIYLKRSVMDFHPRLTFLTCVWLAMKIEEFNQKIDTFCYNIHSLDNKEYAINSGLLSENENEILCMEMPLMKVLNFDLIIHSPFRALNGFKLDIKRTIQRTNVDIAPLAIEANSILYKILPTNLVFLQSPSRLALASLAIGCRKIKNNYPQLFKLFGSYMKECLLLDINKRREVQQVVKDISKFLTSSANLPEIKIDQINFIKEKLENVRNPLYNPKSKEFKIANSDEDFDDSQNIEIPEGSSMFNNVMQQIGEINEQIANNGGFVDNEENFNTSDNNEYESRYESMPQGKVAENDNNQSDEYRHYDNYEQEVNFDNGYEHEGNGYYNQY